MKKKNGLLLVNFGGPRSIEEIKPFLVALLTDKDVICSSLPLVLHKLLFAWIAKRRAKKVVHDYEAIGGKSPIFDDTEAIASALREKLDGPIVTFHRYLPMTHARFLKDIQALNDCDSIRVFPLFPQFSYTTTGSIARWFSENLCAKTMAKFRWIKSYPDHPAFAKPFQATIQKCLDEHQLREEETLLLFSAHGLPKRYICSGDPYQEECERSFELLASSFPKAAHQLCYQSLFGKEEWIRPYTSEFCRDLNVAMKNVVIVPLSFTSDHIETLYEIEQQYLPILKEKGYNAVRCPAMNLREDWIDGIAKIVSSSHLLRNAMLIRHGNADCCACCRETCCAKAENSRN
ncbi:MAG: ferrochelatase [Verrucomicrobia bacterium]|nr:ferrochelatase [Verrucomicrobiota bacterium]